MANECKIYDLPCQWAWIQDEIKAFFVWITEQIFSGILAMVQAIPLPDWVTNVGSYHVPSEIAWFASALEIHTGAVIVGSAYTLRFFIRRLPFIG